MSTPNMKVGFGLDRFYCTILWHLLLATVSDLVCYVLGRIRNFGVLTPFSTVFHLFNAAIW